MVANALDLKEDNTTVPPVVAIKEEKTTVVSALALKKDKTAAANALAAKADMSALPAYIPNSGDALAVPVTYKPAPTTNSHLANKKYVEDQVSSVPSYYLPLPDGAVTEYITLPGVPLNYLQSSSNIMSTGPEEQIWTCVISTHLT